ncbi:MAG: hypothetical protein FRX49_04779 [Trebouxia sp. A1-2]|nr:MAG: hypothetical protein FRX49_04779 [Trebouxia sp. A1-2]
MPAVQGFQPAANTLRSLEQMLLWKYPDPVQAQLSLNVGLHSRHNITLEALPNSSALGSARLPMQKLKFLWRVGVAHHGGTQDQRDRGQVNVYSSGGQGVRVRPQGVLDELDEQVVAGGPLVAAV